MSATAVLFLCTVFGIVVAGAVMEAWQRRLDNDARRRDESHARYMDEIRRQP